MQILTTCQDGMNLLEGSILVPKEPSSRILSWDNYACQSPNSPHVRCGRNGPAFSGLHNSCPAWVIPNAGVGCVKISLMSQAMEHFSCIYCSFVNLLTSLIELLNIWVPLPRVLRQNSFHKIWRILGRKAACSGVMELELS